MVRTLYEVIGVSPTATQAEIEKACLQLGDKHRPDKNPGDVEAARVFAIFEEAFATLSDPVRRAAYDAKIMNKAGGHISAPDVPHRPKISSSPSSLARVAKWATGIGLIILSVSIGLYALYARHQAQEKANLAKVHAEEVKKTKAKKDAEQARVQEILNHLRKFNSRLEVGMINLDYPRYLGEVKAQLDLFASTPEAKSYSESYDHMREAMRHYLFARDVWNASLTQTNMFCSGSAAEFCRKLDYEYFLLPVASAYRRADALSTIWTQAEEEIVMAEIMLRGDEEAKAAARNTRARNRILREKKKEEEKEQAHVRYALGRVRADLWAPDSAEFKNVVHNKVNGAVCGTLIAKNGNGRIVQETFAVDNYGRKWVGSTLTGLSLGASEAKRLCGSQ